MYILLYGIEPDWRSTSRVWLVDNLAPKFLWYDDYTRIGGRFRPRPQMVEYLMRKLHFRNANHVIWFVNAIFFFVFILLFKLKVFGHYIFLLSLVFYGSAVLSSYYVTTYKKRKSDIYSKDCMWFNLIMIVSYWILLYK